MSVNDVLTQGARPLFFRDYLAMSKIIPEKVAALVSGVVKGCRQSGCALLGGETAEMPGFYQDDDYDMAGFAVGVVDREKIIDGSDIALDYQLIGIPSSGIHSNGFSLARKIIFEDLGLKVDSPLLGSTVADILLAPTKIYVNPVLAVLKKHTVYGIVHITGGGLFENIPRILPVGCQALIYARSWERPAIFDFLTKSANMSQKETYTTFNMGLGMILVVAPKDAEGVVGILEDHGERPSVIGKVEMQQGKDRVVLVDDIFPVEADKQL
jgi:phosphoribosylformylglycinamidine cyclo-ligase